MTRIPVPTGSGRSRAASSISGNVIPTPVSSPAAPTPAPAIRNLRRLISATCRIPLDRQVFGGVDGSRDEPLRVIDEFLERGDRAIGPRADADQVTGGVDAVILGGALDRGQVAQRGELVRGPYPCRGARRRQPRLPVRPAVDVG